MGALNVAPGFRRIAWQHRDLHTVTTAQERLHHTSGSSGVLPSVDPLPKYPTGHMARRELQARDGVGRSHNAN